MRSPWSRRSSGDVLRLTVRTLSELCLTAGTLILLFVAYVVLWTGVEADRAMDGEIERLRGRWQASAGPAGGPSGAAGAPAPPPGTRAGGTAYEPGRAFAEMWIPRLGADWHKPVLEGTGTGVLKRGLGHYARSAPLGGAGNFAVAGHRRTYGDPFKDFPLLRPGDRVLIHDGATWYTYTVRKRPLRTVPTDTAVLDPVPRRSGFTAPGRYLTLTTCDPEWGHSHRLIVWAELTETRSAGHPSP
ncbi:class E sortase [Streptomyces sp. NRRL S-87]|uniref:class E sortase n=1 Tax=Streptomyces sp. NRRL S-87 TaxID=1463920 RepID=UPI000689C669|nr:class E sortase [Streptomyces sp. NRRL S-87]